MWWNKIKELEKKVNRLEKDIERLQYVPPESLKSFYDEHKYDKIDSLYWLTQEWFISNLRRERFLLHKNGYNWSLSWVDKGLNERQCWFVGEVYETYLSNKKTKRRKRNEKT